jgi:hypothetical protein
MENINKRRRIILNTRQKIQNVSHKETRIIEHQNQINKNIKFSLVNSSESEFNINLTSIQPTNNFIIGLNPVVWVDSSDLTSLLRDNKNNVYQILDKSGNNNHLYQSNVSNQPKYHNGNLLFNGNQYLTTNNTFTQTINNMSIFIVLKQYNQSSNQGIISGLTSTSTSDITDANTWALHGSDGSTYQYEFNSNSNILLNSSNINTTLPFGIYEIIINNNAAKLYYNGTLINSATFAGLGTFTKLLVGSRYTSSTFNSFFQGEVSEILILNSALSTGNRYKVEKYLLNKWQTTQIPRTIPLSNVYTWLDASSSNNFVFDNSNNLVTWKDMNSRMNFTQTNTTYSPLFKNNKVLFNNSSLTCIDNVGLDLNNFSMFMVFEQVAHTNNARIISCINTIGETDTSVINGFTVLTNTTSNVSLSINSETLTYTDTTALLSKKLYEFVVTNGVGVVYINGVQQATNDFGYLGVGLRFTLGAKQNTTSNPFNGYIYELIILNTGDNYSERNQIYGYLSEKWNLPIISSKPAPYPYMWLDSNNSSSITVNGSNTITAWNDISPNNFAVTLTGTNPVLQTLNGLQSAYFTAGKLEITGGFNGSNATLFLVFSANSSLASILSNLFYSSGTYGINFNSNTSKSSLVYDDGTILKYQTILFNNNLNILSIRYINNVVNIYINNYLINTFSTPTWNFTSMGFSTGNLWVGNIPEFIFYNSSLDDDSYTGTINYLSSKWQININSNLVNEYIPRAVTSTTKSIALTTKSSTTNDSLISPFTIMMTYNNSNATKAYYSYDSVNYILISSLNTIFASGVNGGGIAWNGSIWLACTSGSPAFASSSDGITWTSVSTSPSFTSSTNNFLTWGNDKWILGANNGISYSYDSLNWVNNTILSNCRCAKYNPKTFLWVAGGTGSTYNLVYSINGINWTGSTSGTSLITNRVLGIGCNDSIWVATGLLTDNSSIMIYSFDGITWIKSISGTNVVTNCSSIVWNGKMWVAGGSVIGYSYDGINWLPTSASGTNLTWNGLYWTSGTKYSTDGITWTNISGSITNTITNISAKINQPYRKNVNFLAALCNSTGAQIFYSYNGISWFPSQPFSSNVSVLYYNNNIWIGGTIQNMIFYSFDGINWTRIETSAIGACLTVEYYNNLWIAGGSGGSGGNTMASSTNGIKWTPISSTTSGNPFTNSCNAIKNNGTLWVAGGGDGDTTLAYSSNGTTWNASTSGSAIFDTYCLTLAWNGSIWVAGGQSNTYNLATSTDGMTWTGVTTDFTQVKVVKYHNNLFVAGGSGPNALQYSTNGTNWIVSVSGSDILIGNCFSLSYNGIIWIASGLSNLSAYSYDGINWLVPNTNWTPYTTSGGDHYNLGVGYIAPLNTSPRTVYSNNNFTILASRTSGFYSYYYYSYDGINYSALTSLNSLLSTTVYGGVVGWNGTTWLACSTTQPTGFFASSTDGINWSLITTTPSTINIVPSALGWGKDKWVIGDAGGFGPSYSYDGITWTPITGTISSANLAGIKWNGNIWIAVGSNSGTFNLYYSYDGITWTGSQSASDLVNGPLNSLAYSDSLWVVGGVPAGTNTNSIIYSYDGINWFPSTTAYNIFSRLGANLLVYNGSIWVAGYGLVLGYSYDGINWIISTSGTNLILNYGINAIGWNGSVFIAEQYAHGIIYSYDGINWIESSSPVTNLVNQIISQNNNYIYKKNTNYISIADTTNNSTKFSINAPVPITQTLTNQLTIISTDPVNLSIVDKNVIYNLSEFVPGSTIVLPTLTYNSDYFAFINNGSYDLTITGPNSLNSVLPGNVNQVRYLTNTSGTFSSTSTFQGFTCTLNQYTNAVPTFTVYLGGWSQRLNYIKRLYIFDGTTLVATTGNIYYGLTYQADFTLQLTTGTYTLIVSDTLISTGNIISSTIATPVVYTVPIPSATLDHYINGISLYVITFNNFSPTVTTVDIWSSINSDYSSGSYVTTSTTISNNQASFTYEFLPGYNYITIVDSTDSININITNPIVIYSFIFSLNSTTHASSKNIILDGWANIFTTNLTSLTINMYTTNNFSDTPITLTFPTSTIVNTSGVYTLPFEYFWDIGRYYYFKITDPTNFVNAPVSNYISPLTITGSINSSVGSTNTNNVYTITLSNPESYNLSLFLTNWNIYYANNNLSNTGILITSAPINSSQEITFSYNPGANSVVLYFYVGSTNIFTPPIRWLPTTISNCALWLDASLSSNFTFSSGLNISTWIDRSGNNRTATASNTSMTLTTNQILFNGTNNYFTTTYPATNVNETVFIVLKFNNISGEQDLVSSSTTGGRKYYLNSGNISYENTNESFVLTNGGSPTVSTTYIYAFSSNGTNMIFYRNGSVTNQNTGVYTLSGSGVTLIGGSTGYFNGSISEIIVYTSILTTNQRQLVEGYLALKWGLEDDLPNNHPFYNNTGSISPPTAPYSLTSSAISSTGFTITWSGGINATSYIYNLNGSPVTPATDNGVSASNAIFSGLSLGAQYIVNVIAVNPFGTVNSIANLTVSTTFSINYINFTLAAGSNITITPTNSFISVGGNVTLTILVTDSNSDPVSGEVITVNGSDTSTYTATDNNDGSYTAVVTKATSGIITYTATDADTTVTSSAVTVNYYGAAANISIVSGGTTFINLNFTLTVNVTDANSTPVPGETITITGNDSSSYTGTDNNNGTYTFSVTSSTIRSVVYTANDVAASINSSTVSVSYQNSLRILLKAVDYSGSGTWNDQSGNSNNATKVDGTIAKNSAGNGIVLNGSTSWTFPNVMAGNAWSINVWFKQTGSQTAAGASIVTQIFDSDKVNLTIGDVQGLNNGTYNGGFYNSGWSIGTNITFTTNLWTNIQVTWDGTNLKTYKNTSLLGTTTPGVSSVNSGLAYRIGRGWDDTTGLGYVRGEIGEIRIYNYAITSTQVTSDYNSSVSTFSKPTPVTNLRTTSITPTSIAISWSGGLGATSYAYTLDGITTTPSTNNGMTNKTAIFTGLTQNTIYRINVIAINGNGSNGVGFNVNNINDNKMWLDGADPLGTGTPPSVGSTVATWSDKSGSGNNATGVGSPTYSATGVVFNGTTQYFTTNYTANSTLETAFIVLKFNSVSSNQDLISGSGLNDREYLLFDSNISYTRIGVEITLDNGGSPSANITYLLEYLNNSTTTMNFYTNGALINANSEAYPLTGTGTTTIGAYLLSGTPDQFLNGTISEVIIYNKILTDSQRATLEGYLAWKWSLQSQLPSTHIYYNNPPMGNSIMWSDSNTPYNANNNQFNGVCCTYSGNKIAVASNNGIYTSLDAGATWTLQPATTTWEFGSLFCTPDGSILLYSKSTILTHLSNDFGVTWTQIDTLPTSGSASKICCSSDGTKIANCVSNGWFRVTTDSGTTWTTIYPENGASETVACSTNGSVLILGIYNPGSVLVSSDFGTNFTTTSITVPTSGIPFVTCSPDGSTILVAVSYTAGYIYKSTNSGATFNLMPNTPNANWTSFSISPDGLTLVGTEMGADTWISLDAGATWSKTLLYNKISQIASNYDGSQLIGVIFDNIVPAQNKIYKGSNSNLVVATTLTPPTAPTGLTTSNVTLTGFTVTWTGGNGATSYLYKFNGSNITPRVNNGVANKNATFAGITSGTSITIKGGTANGVLTVSEDGTQLLFNGVAVQMAV